MDLNDFAHYLHRRGYRLALRAHASERSVIRRSVTGVGGEGAVRLDLRASGTGHRGCRWQCHPAGFTAGQTSSIRAPGSGVSISRRPTGLERHHELGTESGRERRLSDRRFRFARITEDVTVHLDSSRLLGNGFRRYGRIHCRQLAARRQQLAANVVNLAVNTGSSDVTVNPLGGSAVATIMRS